MLYVTIFDQLNFIKYNQNPFAEYILRCVKKKDNFISFSFVLFSIQSSSYNQKNVGNTF